MGAGEGVEIGMSQMVVQLTVDELRALIREERVQDAALPSGPDVMTRADVAKLMQVHANVIGRYIRELGFPAHKIGGEWRFLRSEVLAWIADQKEKESA